MRSLVHVAPDSGRVESLSEAVVAGGARLASAEEASALVWADPARASEVAAYVERMPHLGWVALPFAGIEPYLPAVRGRTDLVWTCARDVYSRPVAEHAIGLAVAGLRNTVGYARTDSWSAQVGTMLVDGRITIFGGGGIAREIISLLQGWRCDITIVKRTASNVPGATRVVEQSEALDAVRDADAVILALPLTEETRHIANAQLFDAMPPHCWLVNVARGGVVDHQALTEALRSGVIGGAALDVTEPEPLPSNHPLWGISNAVITPHVGNTPEMGIPLLAAFIERNVASWVSGSEPEGQIDPIAGY